MFGRWKWVAGVVAYLPLIGTIISVYGILTAFSGMETSGSASLGAVGRGISISIYSGLLTALFSLVSSIWFTILLGKLRSVAFGKLLLAFLGMAILPVIIAPICFHILNKPDQKNKSVVIL